ncbi:MAG: glycosyltransferase [Pseudomonadota bacterium]
MKKVLLVHDIVHEYRIPLFKELTNHLNITVAYSKSNSAFSEVKAVKLRQLKFGPFIVFKGLLSIIKGFNIVIFPLDLHYPQFFLYSLLFKKKIIWFGHGVGKSKLAFYIRLPFVKLSKSILLYYDKAKNDLVNKGIQRDKIFVTHNSIYVFNSEYLKADRKNFIYIGRIQDRKKILDACQAINIMKELFIKNESRFIIVGNGDKTKIENYIQKNNLKDIIRIENGTYDENKIRDYFNGAIAYLSPGHIGLGILHSFAYGVPIITSRGSVHGPEFENAREFENSILYDGTIGDLANCLKLLISNKELSHYLGENAFDLYSNHRKPSNIINAFVKAVRYETNG